MTATQEKAGARLYKEMLAHYHTMLEGAERDASNYACRYLDTKEDKYETFYQVAKARVACWDEAIQVLTKNGGDWLRLDFRKE